MEIEPTETAYWTAVSAYYRTHKGALRYGQACMNVLHEHHPALCRIVMESGPDPFYRGGRVRMTAFAEFVHDHWT
jgi:hypothetical protein